MISNKKLLAEAEKVGKLLVCVSSLIQQGLRSSYPGLSSLLLLRFRLLGIDPQTGLMSNVDEYIRTLVQLVGDEKTAEYILYSVLPKKKVFEKVIKITLYARNDVTEALLKLMREYEKDIRAACGDF
ncbi:MAG: hypothetical protein RMI56_03545 [Sulfolobales archaeon]|nr:hypothetical protein [Sulfolobales archaeon]MDW8082855.1 hypothetical protein [Sulfolobales archaeon]